MLIVTFETSDWEEKLHPQHFGRSEKKQQKKTPNRPKEQNKKKDQSKPTSFVPRLVLRPGAFQGEITEGSGPHSGRTKSTSFLQLPAFLLVALKVTL